MAKIEKIKIVNDPVYGFINIPASVLYLIEHPYFQRLRRIMQLGLTYLVYPGAFHARFQHALGATHLMEQAISVLRVKGHDITEEEEKGALAAILLHDIGHGPFSHTLEQDIVEGVNHESLSLMFMHKLNQEFNGELDIAIAIFSKTYKKKFLNQLVSSQLDVDRLDYLNRDSFFTGVAEGVVSADRIIKMMDVNDDQLVIEEKGIYSIEKFLIARRLMYWQVYLHKTVLSAEQLLLKILKRAKEVSMEGMQLFATPSFRVFLQNSSRAGEFIQHKEVVDGKLIFDHFATLDDSDIISCIKVWRECEDAILSDLCNRLINRRLLKVKMQKTPFTEHEVNMLKEKYRKLLKLNDQELEYYVFTGSISNYAYSVTDTNIKIQQKSGVLIDVAEASDILNMDSLSTTVRKYFLCFPE